MNTHVWIAGLATEADLDPDLVLENYSTLEALADPICWKHHVGGTQLPSGWLDHVLASAISQMLMHGGFLDREVGNGLVLVSAGPFHWASKELHDGCHVYELHEEDRPAPVLAVVIRRLPLA